MYVNDVFIYRIVFSLISVQRLWNQLGASLVKCLYFLDREVRVQISVLYIIY